MAMVILAIDLAKAKSLFCWYQPQDQSHVLKTVPSTPQAFREGFLQRQVDRVVIEVRKLLLEIAWGMLKHNPHGQKVFARISKGQKTRRKQAAVALARRVLCWCWAMLRDGTDWKQPASAIRVT